MIAPEDDTRQFWVFTQQCGCPVAVLTDARYTRTQAFRQVYGGVRMANQAIDGGIGAHLVDAATYHGTYAEQMMSTAPCPHRPTGEASA